MLGPSKLEEALETLGSVLQSRGESSRILVAGGSSLLILGFVDRPTADVDLVGLVVEDRYVKAETIPEPLADAARDVGGALGLGDRWLNNAAASLFDFGLPADFERRVTVRDYGNLEVHLPGRTDLIAFKLYAAVDQWGRRVNKHFTDLAALEPTAAELLDAARWTRTHDRSEGFRGELIKVLKALDIEVSDADI